MPRTYDSIIQASLVMAVIVMSPYAMFATRGCAGGSGTDSTTAQPEPRESGGGAATAPEEPAPVPGPTPPAAQGFTCLVPDVPIPRSGGCEKDEPYPSCRWQIPEPTGAKGPWAIWRYTKASSRWGRPALVSLALSAAREYSGLHPGEAVTIGDLDAPGVRHKTHRSGVDMDVYLPGRMATENMGKGRYVENYEGRSRSFVHKCRGHVLDLARILTACSSGRIRIYYNDPKLVESFLEWFGEQGLTTPFDAPMKPHSELHRFHFHVTIPEDLPVLPTASPPP